MGHNAGCDAASHTQASPAGIPGVSRCDIKVGVKGSDCRLQPAVGRLHDAY